MNYVKYLNLFGVDAKEIPCIDGQGAPTTETIGARGCLYLDTDTGNIYKCVSAENGTYVWEDILYYVKQFIKAADGVVNLYEPQTEGWIDRHNLLSSGELGDVNAHTNNANYMVSPNIPIQGNRTYTITASYLNMNAADANILRAYDSTGKALSVITLTKKQSKTFATFTTPENASYIKISVFKTKFELGSGSSINAEQVIPIFNSSFMLIEGENVPTEYIPFGFAGALQNIDLPEKSVKLNTLSEETSDVMYGAYPLYGKKIVNFGDSIFGNARPPQDISTMLAELTGAEVYNCAFGGCRMGQHEGHWDAFSMYRLAYSVANNDFAIQDEAINYSDRTSYAEEPLALLKSIDFTDVDIITIAYGANDYGGSNVIDNEEDLYDTTTLGGAMRYSIEQLLTAFPHLKVFVLLPTYRFWMDESGEFVNDVTTRTNNIDKTQLDYLDAIRDVAESYNLPVIDNYYELGINKFNRLQYFPSNDGSHHNESGRALIAGKLAHELY